MYFPPANIVTYSIEPTKMLIEGQNQQGSRYLDIRAERDALYSQKSLGFTNVHQQLMLSKTHNYVISLDLLHKYLLYQEDQRSILCGRLCGN
jgi:hypothetical protein